MKAEKMNFFKQLNYVILFLAVSQLTSCGSDPNPTAQDKVLRMLTANNWIMQTVTVDDVDKTDFYNGLTIVFTTSNYSTTNGGGIWPASGTWTFTSSDGTTIQRDDGTEIYVDVTNTTLKLTFTWNEVTLGNGRISSLTGLHVFTFIK